MIKNILNLSLGVVLTTSVLVSCTTQKKNQNMPDTHTSQTALDYDGIYRGVLPCADCEGIKTTVYLMRDNTYKQVFEYLGKSEKPFESTGKFTWDKTGSVVTLLDGDQKSMFKVGENTLSQLNQDGTAVTGALAKNYILTKGNYSILNKKWKLVELLGKPVNVENTMKKDAFIQFDDASNRYSASAGCNTINGSFSTEGYNHLSLNAGMSTMMACPNMTYEDQLKEVLATADTFQINGDELILIKGRMAPMARFKVAMN